MSNIQIPDQLPDPQKLYAMSLVAKIKDQADACGARFIGGFIAPDGERFIMTNMEEDDPNYIIPDNLQ